MSFAEVCIYQVKPQKVEEFETLMLEAKELLEQQPGLLSLRLIKRGYRVDMEQIRDGLPPIELTRALPILNTGPIRMASIKWVANHT